MRRNIILFSLGLIPFSSCNSEDDEQPAVNFTIFFETICEETFSTLCVSQEEFIRIREIFEDNQNGDNLDCLPIIVTDLEGTVHEGFLRGFSSTPEDLPCVQELDIQLDSR
nr:hypothetical protein [Allomuricauda sp.]